MAQKTVLSLIALPTGPVRSFSAKVAASVEEAALRSTLAITAALHSTLAIVAVYTCTLNISPAFIAELRVTNASS